jgi:uracil-DNA glycosylase
VLGIPFIGPAGKLLDYIVETAVDGQYSCAWTNLIACLPLGDDGEKTAQPSSESIKACSTRLHEFITMCHPRLIVYVGALSAKHAKDYGAKTIQITHPAAILRSDISQRSLAIQRSIVQISDALEEMENAKNDSDE